MCPRIRCRPYPLTLAVLLLLAARGLAQPQHFTADPAASQVHITLGGSAHTTHGIFHVERGTIDFDRTAATISGSIVVSAGSGNTGSEGRDQRMKEDVLEAPRFSGISFAPRAYTGTLAASGDSMLQVMGIFTLHGAPHPIAIPVAVHIEGSKSTAQAHFIVPYVEWGLKNPSKFILKVDKQVAVDVTLSGTLSPASE